MSHSAIDLNRATLDEMNTFLAERLEGLRRCYNQRLPAHVADPGQCECRPACYQGFDRDWTPAEPIWRRYWRRCVRRGTGLGPNSIRRRDPAAIIASSAGQTIPTTWDSMQSVPCWQPTGPPPARCWRRNNVEHRRDSGVLALVQLGISGVRRHQNLL